MKRYRGRNTDDTLFDVWGIDAPVPGLALVRVEPCDCGADLYAVLHIRSGAALFFAHDPENFGATVWAALGGVDWTRPAVEIEGDNSGVVAAAVRAAFGLVLNAFHGEPVAILNDVPEDQAAPVTSHLNGDRYRGPGRQ